MDNQDRDLPDGQTGELLVRTPAMMVGYWNNPAATAEALRGGWMHTGDLARRDPDGTYWFVGRKKEIIIRGGSNISPLEVEEVIDQHPAVHLSCVVGVPDPKYGEELSAWIKLKAGHTLTMDEIRAFCRAKLAHYKVPKYVKFVESFPQTVTGKIQKFKMREMMKEELGLAEQKTA